MANTSKHGPGFAFGIALGAAIGTGALLLAETKTGKKQIKKIAKQAQQKIEDLKESHPKEAEALDSVIEKALHEAKQATQEISSIAHKTGQGVKEKTQFLEEEQPPLKRATPTKKTPTKRTFKRAGKSLS